MNEVKQKVDLIWWDMIIYGIAAIDQNGKRVNPRIIEIKTKASK